MALILIVDDLPDTIQALQRVLIAHGHEVLTAADGVEALQQLQNHSIDIMILDIHLPNKDGIEVLREVRQLALPTKIIAMSGGGIAADFGILEIAKNLGASATLKKPFGMQDLMQVINPLVQA